MNVDRSSYNKAAKHPPRWGYQARGNVAPSSIIIHTTNNKRATSFESEAVFLCDSSAVSAHFLIGKDGRIIEFLSPSKYQAWHAGNCLAPYLNPRSIGIEHHVSVGETWTDVQRTACTTLVRFLMRAYGISPELVETHRKVALPKGRKSDPEGWDDASFYAWRATLAPVSLPTKTYRVRRILISQRQEGGAPYAGELMPGETVEVDMWYPNGYAHLADGRGFVPGRDLEGTQ